MEKLVTLDYCVSSSVTISLVLVLGEMRKYCFQDFCVKKIIIIVIAKKVLTGLTDLPKQQND